MRTSWGLSRSWRQQARSGDSAGVAMWIAGIIA